MVPPVPHVREGGAAGGVPIKDVLLEANHAQIGLPDCHRVRLVAPLAATLRQGGRGDGGSNGVYASMLLLAHFWHVARMVCMRRQPDVSLFTCQAMLSAGQMRAGVSH